MPSKSKKQHNLMAMVANDPKAAKRMGIPQSVGEEYMKADKSKKFAKGGYAAGGCATKADAKNIAKKEVSGHEKSMHKMKKGGVVEKGTGEKYASKAAMMRHEKKETKTEEAKEHGKVKRMFGGGMGAPIGGMAAGMRNLAKNVAAGPKTFGDAAKAVALRGGNLKGGPKTFPGQKAPTKMGGMGMKKGGTCGTKKYARGGGIEVRGKTRGKII